MTGRTARLSRALAICLLSGAVVLGLASAPSVAADPDPESTPTTSEPTDAAPDDSASDEASEPSAQLAAAAAQKGDTPNGAPYGAAYPVQVEANFARPLRSISSIANSDFTQLEELERLIRGSYRDQRTGQIRPANERANNIVAITVSRMENSYRVGRELIAAAKAGVKVRFIHGIASQSKESRALQSALNKSNLRDSSFRICSKGKSNACLSTVNGAIMHSKILVIGSTYTKKGDPALGVVWTGSANLGGPSGERTYNNGLTVYNDRKMYTQFSQLFNDMWLERNVGNDMINYLKQNAKRYGYAGATAHGYDRDDAAYGMMYSPLSNVTVYPTPIAATPSNGKDPVMNLLNRVKPDSQCRIRLQQNRFKYRRIAVAYKLAELSNQGCKISGVYFEDDLAVNRIAHCQSYIRVCRPILDVFRTSNRRIEAAWAKPHDKTILVDALMTRNELNRGEVAVDGTKFSNWGGKGAAGLVRTQLVQAGSAALTGSNLVASDEVTVETTDADMYDQYLDHWEAILQSAEYRNYNY